MGDVLRTTLVLGLILVVLFFLGQLFFAQTPENPVSEVDYLTAASGVEASAGFDPLVPPSLDEGWRSTVARFDGNRWNLVITSDEQEFLSLEQAKRSMTSTWAAAEVDAANLDPVLIDGVEWLQGTGPHGEVALGREDQDQELSILVLGSGEADDVRRYASSLVPFSTVSDD